MTMNYSWVRRETLAALYDEQKKLRAEIDDLKKPIPSADLSAIVSEYLQAHGYEGLYQAGECACLLDGLFPCDCPGLDCKPGYLESDDGRGNFRIGPDRK